MPGTSRMARLPRRWPAAPAAMPAADTDPFTMYRFMLGDAIPFWSSLQFTWDQRFRSVVYYYFSPTVRLTQTDQINVSDAASIAQHSYQNTGGSAVSLSSSFIYCSPTETLSGRAITGDTSFTVTINPTNAGVVLRRVYDAADNNQRADVYVNGAMVGTWYIAGGVPTTNSWRFHEADYVIPSTATAGMSSIAVRLAITSSAWNEYGYTVFSRTP